jgi:hypothetical protein
MIFAGFRKYATPQELRYDKPISLGPSGRVQRPRGRLEGIMDLRTADPFMFWGSKRQKDPKGRYLGYEMKRDETAF